MATNTRWVRLNVDVFDHPMFEREVFSKREAWIWLIAKAEPRPKTTTVKGVRYNLKRGELVAARDYLAKTWGWTDSKVRAFVAKLARAGDISVRQELSKKPAKLTICKYDEYQVPTPRERLSRAKVRPYYYNNSTRTEDKIPMSPSGDAHEHNGENVQHQTEQQVGDPVQASLPMGDAVVDAPKKRPPVQKRSTEVRAAFDAYNEVAAKCRLPRATKLTDLRAKKIQARLRDYGLDGWKQALGNIEKSAFLRGQTQHGFCADLDFVCRPERFERLHDGGYGNGAHAPQVAPAKLSVDKLPPTSDSVEICRRFELLLQESEVFRDLVARDGREVVFNDFRSSQMRRAGVFEYA